MNTLKPVTVLTALSLIFMSGYTQHLQRKAFLGAALFNSVPDSVKDRYTISGAMINKVVPNSTAATLHLQPYDIITTINGQPVQQTADLLSALKNLYANDAITLQYTRNKKEFTVKTKLVGRPQEPNTQYDEIAVSDGFIRCLLRKPQQPSKAPVVFFIQGFNCSSVDYLMPDDSYKQLIDGLIGKGFAVFRMEKPGVGDSRTKSVCEEIGFNQELAAFKAGYQKLLQYNDIDTSKIFLFGHSLGGIIAPLLAKDFHPKGVVAYGTVVRPWHDYLIDVARIQQPLLGGDYGAIEDSLAKWKPAFFELLHNQQPPASLTNHPGYLSAFVNGLEYDGRDKLFGRHYSYCQQLNATNVAEAWKQTDAHVLSIYGEADLAALNDTDHKRLVEIVNHYHPGKAEFLLLPKTDHGMYVVGTMKEYLARRAAGDASLTSQFNTNLVELLARWMTARIG